MRKTPAIRIHSGKVARGHYLFRLFMAGAGANSKQALLNLRRLCQNHLKDHYTIETVDVTKDFQAAVRDNILVTPALILVSPRPRVTILGNLSDLRKVLAAIGLPGSES
jgi:circadian clock protein KaiB